MFWSHSDTPRLFYSLNHLSPGLSFQPVDALINAFELKQSVYFSTKRYGLLAGAPFARLLYEGRKGLVERAQASLDFARSMGYDNAILIGAIPFQVEQTPSLCVATNVVQHYYNGQSFADPCDTETQTSLSSWDHQPPAAHFKRIVTAATDLFSETELSKVVLSRTLRLTTKEKLDVRKVLARLVRKNSNGFNFAVSLPDDLGRQGTFLGASPELLLRKMGCRISLNPLAGSIPRVADPELDQARAQALLESDKDLREHALVVRSIREILEPLCKHLMIPERPSLMQTDSMWHLSTEIEGELNNNAMSSLELALALHPTPAVCGYPTDVARRAILELEGYDRGLFTGLVGWCNAKGDGEWAIAIRCATIQDNEVQVFAGAGIVSGSCPEKEYRETHAKFQTMLRGLGVSFEDSEVKP
jgi:isochorismate synthase